MNFAGHADFHRALALAGRLADTSRAIAQRYFRRPLEVERKPDSSPVTAADRAIETELRRMIRAEFPTHGIQGEEFEHEPGTEFTWVLDPIDGTKSFITGFPLFGSLIALVREGEPMLGVIEAPAMGERWVGCSGLPTLFNGATARVSVCDRIEQAHVYTTTADTFSDPDRLRFDTLSRRAALRRFGGDCYLYGLLASGHCDLVIEAGLKPHDFLALVPVVQGAGGRISDWQGAPLGPHSGDHVVAAATESLWRQAIDALSSG
jgi:inositol-phosphate phosphatase / L-galactose 1-phosphate phosphatase / histidinol-phosphatase